MQPDDVIGGHWAGENSPQPQCDPSPLRAAVDTGSEEPGTPPRSHAIGTGPGLGVSRAETQIEEQELFPFKTNIDGFFNPNFTSTQQECVLLQTDIEMDDNNETTTHQAPARKEFARLTKKRQQQGMTAWSTDQSRQFDRGRSRVNSLLFEKEKCLPCVLFACFFSLFVLSAFCLCTFPALSANCRSRYERR